MTGRIQVDHGEESSPDGSHSTFDCRICKDHHDSTSLQVMGPYFDITVTNIVNFLEISSLANGVFTSLADIIHSSSICLLTKFQLMFSV